MGVPSSAPRTYLLCFKAEEGICPDTAQPDQVVNARTLRHMSCRDTQLYFLRGFTNGSLLLTVALHSS